MDTSFISGTTSSYTTSVTGSYPKSEPAKAADKADSSASKKDNDIAAVYEKSSSSDTVTGSTKNTKNLEQNSAIIEQMKADLASRQQQLTDIVSKMMSKQGKALGLSDDMWKFLASGDFTVDEATKAQAQKDIAEDGYWGVKQTSDRIVDFAKVLAGDDPEKADKMIEAFKKGFEEATGAWGKELPDISKQTYDAVLQKMDDWKNSKNTGAETE